MMRYDVMFLPASLPSVYRGGITLIRGKYLPLGGLIYPKDFEGFDFKDFDFKKRISNI
jgi:hypothetical protein